MQIKRNSVKRGIVILASVEKQGLWAVSPLFRELSCGNWPCSLEIHGSLPGYPTFRDLGIHTHQFSIGVL